MNDGIPRRHVPAARTKKRKAQISPHELQWCLPKVPISSKIVHGVVNCSCERRSMNKAARRSFLRETKVNFTGGQRNPQLLEYVQVIKTEDGTNHNVGPRTNNEDSGVAWVIIVVTDAPDSKSSSSLLCTERCSVRNFSNIQKNHFPTGCHERADTVKLKCNAFTDNSESTRNGAGK